MIDILPLNQKTMIRRIRFVRILTTILVSIVVLMIAAALLLLPTFETIQSRTTALHAYTRELEENGLITTTDDIATLESRTKLLSERLASKVPESPLIYIDIIKSYRIQGVRITGYDIPSPEKRMIQLRGIASTRQTLQQFITALDQDARIATVDSPVTNFVKSTDNEFTLTITFTQS